MSHRDVLVGTSPQRINFYWCAQVVQKTRSDVYAGGGFPVLLNSRPTMLEVEQVGTHVSTRCDLFGRVSANGVLVVARKVPAAVPQHEVRV